MLKLSIRSILMLAFLLFMLVQIGLLYTVSNNALTHIDGDTTTNAEHIVFSELSVVLVIVTLLTVLVIMLLINWLIFRRVTHLIEATQKFAGGDFSARVHIDRQDELSRLSAAFNDMAQRVEANYYSRQTSEIKLSEKESRLIAIINTAVDGIIVTTTDNRIDTFNPAAERIFGYSAAEIIGQKFSTLISGKHDITESFTSSSTNMKGEFMGRRKNGTVFPMDMALSVVSYGDSVFFTATVRDITTRKNAEEALHISTQRLEGMRAIAEALLKADTMDEVASAALQHVRKLIPCQRVDIAKVDVNKGELVELAVATNLETQIVPNVINTIDSLMLIPLKSIKHHYIEDLETQKELYSGLTTLFDEGIRSLLTIPLMVEDEMIGVLNLSATSTHFFTPEHISIAHEIAGQIKMGFRQIILYDHVIHYAEELGERIIERTAEAQTFRTLVDNSIDSIVIIDATKSCVVYANKATYHTYGYDPNTESIVGQDPRVFWLDEDLPIIAEVAKAVRKGGWSGDVHQKRADGSIFEVNANAFELYDPQGQLHFGVSIRDITARKRAEQSLRRLSNFQQAILDSAKAGIISADLNGLITSFNAGAEQILGYSAAEVVGSVTTVTFHDIEELQHHAQEISRGLEITLKPGNESLFAQASLGQSAEAEWTLIRKDGSRFPALLSITAIRDEVGGIAGFLNMVTDITEQKLAQTRLMESRDFYLTLFESFPAMIWRCGTDMMTNYFNQTWLDFTGRPLEEEIGVGWVKWIHPEDRDLCLNTYEECFALRIPFALEYRLMHRSGEYRWILDSGNPFNDLDDSFAGYIGVCYDITERKQAEQALLDALEKERELGELKSRFVSMASHEFRTPLATILATTDALGAYRHKMNESQIDHRINKIRGQVDHLRGIMDDVLQLARMQAHKSDFTPIEADFDEYCRDILDEFQNQPDITHQLVYTCAERPLRALFDTKLVRKIVANLVSNAIKYSPDKTSVFIDVTRQNHDLVLQVRDEGIGISSDDQKHLFEAFHRGVNVGTISGTGLGLSIAHQSAELHNGSITCTSVLGEGTTFTVTLPILRPTTQPI